MSAITFVDFCGVVALALTSAQRVYARVAFDQVPPHRLDGEERELARTIFGDVDDVPPDAFRVLVGVFGRGSGKDEIGAVYGLWRMLTADLAGIGPGDVPSFIAIAPDMKLGAIAKMRAHERAKLVPSIARLIEAETADGFALRRPQDGKRVAFEVLAATRAGSAARGRSVIGALLSECAFFRDETAAINDSAIYSAILPRLRVGGAILLFSTPWAEAGLFFDLFEKNHGRPRTALVAQASTLTMRGDDPQIRAIVATETERDPLNAERELGARFIGIGASNFFDPSSITAAIDPNLPHPFPYPGNCGRAVGIDLGLKIDASAQVIALNQKIDGKDIATIAYVDEMRPSPGAPLSPTVIMSKFAKACLKYEARSFMADAHYEMSIREIGEFYGLRMYLAPTGNAGKAETYLAAKELFTEGKAKIPNHPRLVAQLKAVIAKPMPGGLVKIEVPRRLGQSHGDIASAAVLALYQVRSANAGEPARKRLAEYTQRLDAAMAAYGYGEGPEALRALGFTAGTADHGAALHALARGESIESASMSIWERLARINQWHPFEGESK